MGRRIPWDQLTRSEVEILEALADGDSQLEIATDRHVSQETVKSQMKSLRAKLGATTTAHAVALAYHRGWLVPMSRRP